jgi:hypothetical protein
MAGRPPPFPRHPHPGARVLAEHGRDFFSILQRRLLRRGEFTSRAHLAGKILEFICAYDDKARPFRWSYDGRPLKAA